MDRSPFAGLTAALLAGLAVSACASGVPPAIRTAPADPVTPEQAREGRTVGPGARVRWGGRILEVHNRPRESDLEVLALPLGHAGEPDRQGRPMGRFLARMEGFVDPAVYRPDRLVTVYGVLSEPVTRPVGEYPYRYPVVEVADRHLWQEPPSPDPREYWCDPWWDPFYARPYGRARPWPCW